MFSPCRTIRVANRAPGARHGGLACRLALPFLAVFIALVGPPSSAPAGDVPTTRPTTAPSDRATVAKWLTDLASTDPAARDTARSHLMRLHRADLPTLQQLLRRDHPLAPAQAMTLRQVVQEIYLAGEPYDKDPSNGGFLGIYMDGASSATRDLQQANDAPKTPGIVVADLFSGFCAARVLREGDVILGTVSPVQVFNNVDDLKTAVGGAEPGSTIHLQVLRQGQVIQVPLTLDPRPAEIEFSAESFRRQRAEKFDDYWREAFAPLLKQAVG